MKLIVGLGNPGAKYKDNRHNAGFQFLDYFFAKIGAENTKTFRFDKKTGSEIVDLTINNEKILLVKPQLYMNNSGQVVGSICSRYKIQDTKSLYVAHDDLDIRLGEYKIQLGRGPKLHNGIESIEKHLHTKDFWRVRIGVDNRLSEGRIAGENYVLADFIESELTVVSGVFTALYEAMLHRI